MYENNLKGVMRGYKDLHKVLGTINVPGRLFKNSKCSEEEECLAKRLWFFYLY
jgi:hypothetical protein